MPVLSIQVAALLKEEFSDLKFSGNIFNSTCLFGQSIQQKTESSAERKDSVVIYICGEVQQTEDNIQYSIVNV